MLGDAEEGGHQSLETVNRKVLGFGAQYVGPYCKFCSVSDTQDMLMPGS